MCQWVTEGYLCFSEFLGTHFAGRNGKRHVSIPFQSYEGAPGGDTVLHVTEPRGDGTEEEENCTIPHPKRKKTERYGTRR